ncbi:hypothetical protein Tco_0905511 [Tanacetum coccineum]
MFEKLSNLKGKATQELEAKNVKLAQTVAEANGQHFTKKVTPYKKLRRNCFIDSIPKNAPGKVLRKEFMELALSRVTSKL